VQGLGDHCIHSMLALGLTTLSTCAWPASGLRVAVVDSVSLSLTVLAECVGVKVGWAIPKSRDVDCACQDTIAVGLGCVPMTVSVSTSASM
jgi:hypothetical protein